MAGKGNRRPSVMKHKFSEVPSVNIPRSSFDRSHGLKTTFESGKLIPILVDEALPGDTFTLDMTAFARLATPIKPIMDNMFLETFFFAVPNRLVWDNWEKFNGAQDNPSDSTDFTVPQFNQAEALQVGGLHDYMGIPTGVPGLRWNSLHARAYNLIWNEWFRDQNLQDSIVVDKDDTGDQASNYVVKSRGKRHDYFTSALPWPQKGDPVSLPIGGFAPVERISNDSQPNFTVPGVSGSNPLRTTGGVSGDGSEQVVRWLEANNTVNNILQWGSSVGLQADLSQASSFTINSIREGFQIQRMFERDARGGTRYTEIIQSHFNVTSPDARLQRPEYLGGGSTPINITPIAQTESTTEGTQPEQSNTPQGNLAAIGTAVANRHGFTKSFTEHCLIIGLVNVRADLTYQQGLNRMFSRRTRFDYYWPSLAHLGEQAILNKEIYSQGSGVSDGNGIIDDQVFGYQERYAEYRYKPSQITGKFRSTDPQSLDIWHLSQNFGELPKLNEQFILDNPPVKRVIAVQDEPQFLLDCHFNYRCARPMPMYGVPGLIDHF